MAPMCEHACREEIFETFTPWYEDPRRISRLLRWLVLMGEVPASIPDFIESAETWGRQYEEMLLWSPEAKA